MPTDLQTLRHDLVNDPDSNSGKIWRNGRAFYSQGMVTDVHRLGEILAADMERQVWILTSLLVGHGSPLDRVIADKVVNSQQMHLIWQPLRDGHVHRETTALENTRLALELSLKAVLTRCGIPYDSRHDLLYLWELLESANRRLVREIRHESQSFYHSYGSFLAQLRSLRNQLRDAQRPLLTYGLEHMPEIRRLSKDIDALALSSSYSSLPNGYAPDNDQWLDGCLDSFKDWRNQGIRLWTYLRYGDALEDEMPIPIIRSVHLMARFMYEHLVQIPRQLNRYANSLHRLWPDSLEQLWDNRIGNSPE